MGKKKQTLRGLDAQRKDEFKLIKNGTNEWMKKRSEREKQSRSRED